MFAKILFAFKWRLLSFVYIMCLLILSASNIFIVTRAIEISMVYNWEISDLKDSIEIERQALIDMSEKASWCLARMKIYYPQDYEEIINKY